MTALRRSAGLLIVAFLFGVVPPSASAQTVIKAAPGRPLEDAVARAADSLTGGASPGGVVLELAAGRYPLLGPITLDQRHSGSTKAPFVIRAAPGAAVVLDGSRAIDTADFSPVTDADERGRLAASARDAILVATVRDPVLRSALRARVVMPLLIDDESWLPARFPDAGYARLAPQLAAPEASPPAITPGKEGYGIRAGHEPYRVPGRARGWLGSLDEPRGGRARIAVGENQMAGHWMQWQRELARDNSRNRLTGFLDANWLRKTQSIVGAHAGEGSLHLSQVMAYGWRWRANDKPFFVYGMLCELNRPGEWHFDALTDRLYLYPPVPLTPATRIRLPVATGAFRLGPAAHHIELRGLTIENLARGTALEIAGHDNLASGLLIRRSTARGISLNGRDNRVLGCDLVDLDHHLALGGGARGPGRLEAGGNLVENCHLYQRRFRDRKVSASVRGVGNALRHCLIHNSLGQAVTVHGNDHRLAFNELFNIGYDEGDGGAIYAGADLAGYGTVYRHNFFHHLMHVRGKVERSGIHLDDLQAGSTCIGNLFFKSAGKGIFMNGGAGHVLRDNVFLEGFRGIYNVGAGARKNFDRQEAIRADAKDPRRHSKEDYVGRVERALGSEGWNREPFASRFPLFAEVMNDRGLHGRLAPIRCTVTENWYHGNGHRRPVEGTIWSRVSPEAKAKSRIAADRRLDPAVFVNYDALDLRVREGVTEAPLLPFERIGLYLDEHRRQRPAPAVYRRAVRDFFRDATSMSGTPLRLDTGELVETVPIERARD